MNFVIIEDEKPNANRLRKLVEEIAPTYKVIEVLHTVADSIMWFSNHKHPDIILIDVRLSDGLSFDILSQVKINSAIIFTTAYDEFAFRAFKVNGVDYLLKPIEKEELVEAIRKARLITSQNNDSPIQEMLHYIKQKDSPYRTRFLIPYKDGFRTIAVADVDYIYSEFKNTFLKLKSGNTELITLTLEELEEQLNPDQFFRVNRQFIINIESLQGIHNHFHGKLKLVLRNNPTEEIFISKDKAPVFKQWLDR